MSETRARHRIRRAVESRGFRIESIEWEPIYYGGEMDGMCGGWEIVLDRPYVPNTSPGDDLFGLNVEEVLAAVDYWLPPPSECGCDRQHDPISAARRINDPEKPTHSADCAHHIAYRLPWWKAAER